MGVVLCWKDFRYKIATLQKRVKIGSVKPLQSIVISKTSLEKLELYCYIRYRIGNPVTGWGEGLLVYSNDLESSCQILDQIPLY